MEAESSSELSPDSQLEDHVILLPHHHDPVTHFALDIGGSLIKMVYYESSNLAEDIRSGMIFAGKYCSFFLVAIACKCILLLLVVVVVVLSSVAR